MDGMGGHGTTDGRADGRTFGWIEESHCRGRTEYSTLHMYIYVYLYRQSQTR